MMYTENDTTTFHLLAPQKGIYLLDIFAASYPSMDMCTKKEATKYINVCRFKIDCPDTDMVSAYKILKPTCHITVVLKQLKVEVLFSECRSIIFMECKY